MRPARCSPPAAAETPVRCTPSIMARNSWVSLFLSSGPRPALRLALAVVMRSGSGRFLGFFFGQQFLKLAALRLVFGFGDLPSKVPEILAVDKRLHCAT